MSLPKAAIDLAYTDGLSAAEIDIEVRYNEPASPNPYPQCSRCWWAWRDGWSAFD